MPIIVKGDGSVETFDPSKLERSLKHAGAPDDVAESVATDISTQVKEGMTTTEIYRNAYQMLHKAEHVMAARYSMRRAILELGPTGFPFEQYVAELFRAHGYTAETDVIVKGKCVEHEVDVVFKKDGKTIGAELKFHNTPGFKTDLKTALYVKARYDDIAQGNDPRNIHEGWLITNTKFTENAVNYAACAGLTLLGWNFPNGQGLADMIAAAKLYPVTVLTDLTVAEKERLMAEAPLCTQVTADPTILERADIPVSKRARIVAQSTALCR